MSCQKLIKGTIFETEKWYNRSELMNLVWIKGEERVFECLERWFDRNLERIELDVTLERFGMIFDYWGFF